MKGNYFHLLLDTNTSPSTRSSSGQPSFIQANQNAHIYGAKAGAHY